MLKRMVIRFGTVVFFSLYAAGAAQATIAQSPLYLSTGVPPVVMLTMGRDHKLYYEAYNDASDLNGDGELDIRYKPSEIDYFGYFDSFKCYKYASSKFTPISTTSDKTCGGSARWSGDFLNYLTTSRMDALRKVLYGGYRSTDSTSSTILERAFIPQDAHSWGKEYNSVAVDGYDIADYTPLSPPTGSNRHLFASTTLSTAGDPVLRVLTNKSQRIWQWLSKESPVADNSLGTPTDYKVFVDVCLSGLLEINCTAYSDGSTITYKPTGILQKHGDDDSIAFGLLTGSYENNISGGVIRKNISSFTDEVNSTTGVFSATSGIVDTIDKLAIAGYRYSSRDYSPGWSGAWLTTRAIVEGEANDWGNPIAEMMYEGLRYFAGKSGPTPDFSDGVGGSSTYDSILQLPLPAWQDPYSGGGFDSCAKPIQLVISDINPSYDTDQVPGSYFEAFSGDLTGLDASALADTIWAGETEASNVFIGESAGISDGSPSAKAVTSFKNIRGLAPEEPTKLGGYYAGSVALYGQQTDISSAMGNQNVDTLAVVLASPLPRIEIPVSNKIITLVPFAKSVGWPGHAFDANEGAFQPTDQIVDFYVEVIANTGVGNMDASINFGRPYGKFNINYEDVEQAADHDMDAIAEYEFKVDASNNIIVILTSTYASGSIQQHMGYVISGTTADGTYLEVRDYDTAAGSDPDYFLDTPPGELPGGNWDDNTALPLTTSRTFTVGTSASASFIKHDPLWYAAKWSMPDEDGSGTLEANEWDADSDGDPDGYFLVTNAGKLEEQLNKAFDEIVARISSSAAVATNSTRLDTNSKIYQARFNSGDWSGELLAFNLNPADGTIGTQAWNAATLIPSESSRKIYSYDPAASGTNKGIVFEYANLNATQQGLMDLDHFGTTDALGSDRADYIRGDVSTEIQNGGAFRDRGSLMGDIINSDPWFSGRVEDFGYSELAGGEGTSYASHRQNKITRTPAVFFAANDAMLHAINAETGAELFTYVPDSLVGSLSTLTNPMYGCEDSGCIAHRYFIDGAPRVGDAYFDSSWHSVLIGTLASGGKGLFAIDVTDPDPDSSVTPSLSEFTENNVLWEISTQGTSATTQAPGSSSDITDFADNLGYTLSQASVVRMHDGSWAAVVANGYESAGHSAVLFIIDIETGAIIESIDTGVGDAGTPNGLSTPIVVDEDGDRIADSVYAGDLLGNMWKFDVTGNSNNWDVAYKTGSTSIPLFEAVDVNDVAQPITAKPQVGKHPDGGLMVYFGTGKYYSENDQIVGASPQVQTFYGIRDSGEQVSSRSRLQEQEILDEATIADYSVDVRVTTDTAVNYRDLSDSEEDTNYEGWFMELESPVNGPEGERAVSAPLLRAGRIIFTTLIPDPDPCDWGGSSWLMELDAVNGSRLDTSPLDVNGDGVIDNSDFVAISDTNGDGVIDELDDYIPISGLRRHDLGIIKTPGVVICDSGSECKYTSGSSGNLDMVKESSGSPTGRQSWRQLR